MGISVLGLLCLFILGFATNKCSVAKIAQPQEISLKPSKTGSTKAVGDTVFFDNFEGTHPAWKTKGLKKDGSVGSFWADSPDSFHSGLGAWWRSDDTGTATYGGNVQTAEWFQFVGDRLTSVTFDIPSYIESAEVSYWNIMGIPDVSGGGTGSLEDFLEGRLQIIKNTWHTDTFKKISGDSSWWNGEPGLGGGAGGYGNWNTLLLDSPEIDLVGKNPPITLSFKNRHSFEPPEPGYGWDAANLKISTDGGNTFSVLTPSAHPYDRDSCYAFFAHAEPKQPGWCGKDTTIHTVQFDLSTYAGKKIILRFDFRSDDCLSAAPAADDPCGVTDPSLFGWILDEIKVVDGNNVIVFYDDGGDTEKHMIPVSEAMYSGLYASYWAYQLHTTGYDPDMPHKWFYFDDDTLYKYQVAADPGTLVIDKRWAGQKAKVQFKITIDDNYDGGNGIGFYLDDFWVSALKTVDIELAPDSTTLHRGSKLSFNLKLTNNSAQTQTVQVWTGAFMPNGEPYSGNPILGPKTVTLTAHQTITRKVTHKIPNNAPYGTYTYCGYTGTYPTPVWDQDCFKFSIVP